MNFGMILIWLAFLTGSGATVLSIAHHISERQDRYRVGGHSPFNCPSYQRKARSRHMV